MAKHENLSTPVTSNGSATVRSWCQGSANGWILGKSDNRCGLPRDGFEAFVIILKYILFQYHEDIFRISVA